MVDNKKIKVLKNNRKKENQITQWGWPSGYALDLKVAILGFIGSSTVQVQALAL